MSQDRRPNSSRTAIISALILFAASTTLASAERRSLSAKRHVTAAPSELMELRTEFDSVFLDGQGRASSQTSAAPKHSLSEDGTWLPISPRLVEQPDGSMLDEANSLTSHFPSRADGETMLWRKADGAHLAVRPAGLAVERADGSVEQIAMPWGWSQARTSNDGAIIYQDIYPGVSERYSVEAGRVRHDVVLGHSLPNLNLQADDVLVISWDIESDGMHGARDAMQRRSRSERSEGLTASRGGVRLPVQGRTTLRLAASQLPKADEVEDARYPTPIDELATFLSFGAGAHGASSTGLDCETSELQASDAALGNQMGFSVSLDGDVAVIGSPRDSELAPSAGAVHVFQRSGEDWTETAKLTASDAASGDGFGWGVSLSGDLLLVGAPGKDDLGASSGAAYVFERSLSGWEEVQLLTAADGATGDVFGRSLSVSGELAIVSADGDDDAGIRSGSAYVFALNDGSWSQEAKLIGSDTTNGDRFGFAVDLDGETAIIGAPSHQVAGAAAGASYIFERMSGWSEQATFTAPAGSSGNLYGASVAISGDRVLVGAPGQNTAGIAAGAAHVYARSGASWSVEAELLPSIAAAGDEFGRAVAIHGAGILVGASAADDAAPNAGAALLFINISGSWNELDRIVDAGAGQDDGFGAAVALSADTTLVGVAGHDDGGRNAGSASIRSCSFE